MILLAIRTLRCGAAAGLTEEALEATAEQYREPAPSQAAPDLAGDEWPDLHAAATNGKHSLQAGIRPSISSNKVHAVLMLPKPRSKSAAYAQVKNSLCHVISALLCERFGANDPS